MQPQQVYPTIPPPTTVQPTMPAAALSTDQRIAQENAQVFVFEHGPPDAPRQHKVLDFIGQHKSTLAIALVAVVLMSSGAAFAFTKLQTFTKAPKVQTSTSLATNQADTSAGGGTPDDSADTTADSTDEDTSAATDDSADSGDSGDTNDTEADSNDATNDAANDTATDEGSETNDAGDNTPPESNDPVEVVPIPAPTPVPAKPSPVIAHKFTTASWNSNVDNKNNVGDEIKTIMSKTQILGVQEVHHADQRASITSKVTCSSCAYAGYLASYSSGTASQSSYPIIWNKSYFSAVGSGSYRKMCDAASTSKYSYAARYATYVKLQSKVNGKQFYVVNTHFMGVGESSGKPGSDTLLTSRYKTHMTNLVALINELKSANIPIYVVGRFNVNYRYDHTVKTNYFPYISLGAVGLRSGWDVTNLSGISGSAGTDGTSSRLIDYVFALQRSDVTSNSVAISTSQHGSGNYVAFYTTTIK